MVSSKGVRIVLGKTDGDNFGPPEAFAKHFTWALPLCDEGKVMEACLMFLSSL